MIEKKKTLLLNLNYEFLSFISYKKALKLVIKNKTDILSTWADVIHWNSSVMKLPSVLKLKHFVHRKYTRMEFSRRAVFRRDNYQCQYCRAQLTSKTATMDHIVPKSLGGKSSFLNCVAACHSCNIKKGSKTLEQVGLTLIKQPEHPRTSTYFYIAEDIWHEDWANYIRL